MESSTRSSRWSSWIALLCAATLVLPAATARAEGLLYFAEIFYPTFSDGHIWQVDTHGVGLEMIDNAAGGLRAIALNPEAEDLYWTDVDWDAIMRIHLPTSHVDVLPITGLSFPNGVAVLPSANLLCWGDATAGVVGAAQLNGTGAHTLLATPFHCGIAFDRLHQKIYWSTALTATTGEIRRANLNGSNVEVVVVGYGKPARIALDPAGGKIYWTDYVLDAVARANMDGTSVTYIYAVGSNLNPDGIALDLEAGKVYWGQSYATNREKIMRMNLNGSNPEDVLVGTFGIITDIVFATQPAGVEVTGSVPAPTLLRGAWPNPFSGETAIRLDLPEDREVRLTVHTADGRQVAALFQGTLPAGSREIRWDGRSALGRPVPGGIYYCRIETGGLSQAQKLLLSR